MKVLRIFSRFIIGFTFLFSGFVKGQDPLGTVYRIEDYLIAYGWDWAMPYALFLSVLLCTAEFALGAGLVLNVKIKIVTWLVFLMMLFFTIVTFFDAIYNPVPDCGCFGDAIILTNWQTFWKNIVLMLFVGFLFYTQKASSKFWTPALQTGLLLAVILLFGGFSVWSYRHLPVIDFMAWKVGKNMYPERSLPVTYFVTYKNTNSGEVKEYPADNYPFNDSLWMKQWVFVSSRVNDPNKESRHNLLITDSTGTDVTDIYLKNSEYQLVAVSYDFTSCDIEMLSEIAVFGNKSENANVSFIFVTPALKTEINSYSKRTNAVFPVLNADDVTLKTMVRANPGLILFKNGIVLNKWNWRDVPEFEIFSAKYLK